MRWAVAAAALLAAGCALGPNYRRPTTPMSGTFRGQETSELSSFADLPWWEIFDDRALLELIREALTNSYSLEDALARVEQARELAGVAAAALLPSLDAQAGASYQQVFSPLSSLAHAPGAPKGNLRYPAYRLSTNLSWELDLWGRLRRLKQAALAEFLATEDARRGVVVSLIGDIAQGYFNLLALDLELEIANETVQARAETLRLFAALDLGGVGTRLQTASEQANVAAAAASVPDLERQIAVAENQLSLLVGRVPGPIARSSNLRQRAVPAPGPAGLPGALLGRRPDVRQAEAEMVSANAQIGAACAAQLPTLTLGANGGFAATSPHSLFTPNALTYGVDGSLGWLAPILNGKQLRHRYRAARANWRSTVARYRGTVLNALVEVSNALVAIDKLRLARLELEIEVAAWTESLKLARDRFSAGVASYLDVVQAEQNLLPAELTLAQTIGGQFMAHAQLYRALGGGWSAQSETAAAQATRTAGD